MSIDFAAIDPKTAWQPYASSAEKPWNRARAAHLFRRAGFGATWRELTAAAAEDPQDAVGKLLATSDDAAEFEKQMQTVADTVVAGGDPQALPPWWLYRMLYSPTPLAEKMTFFWHGHFATSAAKVQDARLMLAQHALFRDHALGNFGPLVQAISRDPAMLLYLDSATNRKNHPNENYARELMELFCLGAGQYTEKDIQQLARALTGFEVYRGRFRMNEYEHDRGSKVILGQRGEFHGSEGVAIVVDQSATPQLIARKLFRYFIADEPVPPDELIEPLARQLSEHDLDVRRPVETLLRSDLFFAQQVIGRKVRSPVELGVGLLRAVEGTTNLNDLAPRLEELGQLPFYPPSVKGWDGGRTWINSATLLGRANLVHDLATRNQEQIANAAKRSGAKSPEELVDWTLALLVAVDVPPAARAALLKLAAAVGDENGRAAKVLSAVGLLPEFQLA